MPVVRSTTSDAVIAPSNSEVSTSTASILCERSSFIACAPAENPKLVIAFIIHDPDKSIAHYGGAVAAPGALTMERRRSAGMAALESAAEIVSNDALI